MGGAALVRPSKTLTQDSRPTDDFQESKDSQSIDTPKLRQRAAIAFAPFGFYDSQKAETIDAYLEAPDGVDEIIRCAVDSNARGKLRGAPASVILAAIRRGDHLRAQNLRENPPGRKTGYRWVYGEGHASGTFIEDPAGTDQPPPSYDFQTRNPHEPGAWRA